MKGVQEGKGEEEERTIACVKEEERT